MKFHQLLKYCYTWLFIFVNIFVNFQAIPVYWVIMSRKTEEAYVAVLRFLRGIMNVATWRVIMCDFELAMRNAFARLVPHARISGCTVHFDRVR